MEAVTCDCSARSGRYTRDAADLCLSRAARVPHRGPGRAGLLVPWCGMAAQCSFDITSTVDLQEVDNALNQARKEVAQRYDFKGAKADLEFDTAAKTLTLAADDRFKLDALWEIVQTRLVRRGVPVKNFKPSDAEPAAGGAVRRTIALQQGVSTDAAREIVRFLKDQKLKKVQAAIQGDQIRVSAPSRDDLQDAMARLRDHDFGIALQFGNYRG